MRKIAYFLLCLYAFTLPSGTYFDLKYIGAANVFLLIISLVIYTLSIRFDPKKEEWLNFSDFYTKRRFFFLVCLFFAIVAMTYFWTQSQLYTLIKLKISLLIIIATFLILELVDTKRKLQIIMHFFLLGGYVSILGILYSFFFDKFFFQDTVRYTSYGLNPNDFGLIMAISIPMAWYLAYSQKNQISKWIMSFFIPLAVISIFLTGSRGSFVALLVSLTVIPWTYLKIPKQHRLFLIITIIIAAFFVIFYIPSETINRIFAIFDSVRNDDLSQRIDIWRASIQFIPNNLTLGVGAGAFMVAIRNVMSSMHVAHNTLLSVFGEEGIFGLIIFIAILLVIIVKISKIHQDEGKIWTVVLSTWFVGTLVLSWDFNLITWFIFSLMIATPTGEIYGHS